MYYRCLNISVVIISLLILASHGAWASDAMPIEQEKPVPMDVPSNEPIESVERSIAESEDDIGRKALRAYRKNQEDNPRAIIDAAIAFENAHRHFIAIGDTDAVSEMQANIYWCKKQMNIDTLKEYLSRNGSKNTLTQMHAIEEKSAVELEVKACLESVKKFSDNNLHNLTDIFIQFCEVATRSPGTLAGLDAQSMSLDAHNLSLHDLQDDVPLRKTIFTPSSKGKIGIKSMLPNEQLIQHEIANLKFTYAKEYSRKSELGKRCLAKILMTEASHSRGEAAIYYAILIEAIRLAQESEDYGGLLDGIDLLAEFFENIDASAEKKVWLRKIIGKPNAASLLLFLEKPTDPSVNAVIGIFFCLQLNRWKQGLEMLTRGNDHSLKEAADKELNNPSTDEQIMLTGDAWYSISKKSSIAEKIACLKRAKYWYLQIYDTKSTIGENVHRRIVELDKALPLDMNGLDWENLTPSQWEMLKGPVGVVQVRADRSGPIIFVNHGESIRIVPHPTDTWICQGLNEKVISTWSGSNLFYQNGASIITNGIPAKRFRFGELLCQVGKGELQSCGIIAGPGPVWLIPNRTNGENKGEIRYKLIPIVENE